MRLLLLTIEFPPGPGGIGTFSYHIAYQLSNLGWKAWVSTPQKFAIRDQIETFNKEQPFSIQQLTYCGPFLFESFYRFISALFIIFRNNIDIIISVGEQPTWLGAILSFLSRIPFIAVGNGTEFIRGNRIRHLLTRVSYNYARIRIANSQYTLSLMRAIQINAENTYVINCGADHKHYRKDLPVNNLSIAKDLVQSKVILTVGQVSPRKAQDIVIRALPRIREVVPEVKYLIVGIPLFQKELEELASELGVLDDVFFLGQVTWEQLPYFYNLADVFVLVSRQTLQGEVEGFGIVVLEAALCGKPAIVSNNSGLVETVINGRTGIVVESDNPEATADAIIKLLVDDNLRKTMGEAAYTNAIRNFTWETRMRGLNNILLNLVG